MPPFCFPKGPAKAPIWDFSLALRFGLTLWAYSLVSQLSSLLPRSGAHTESWSRVWGGWMRRAKWWGVHTPCGGSMSEVSPAAHGKASCWSQQPVSRTNIPFSSPPGGLSVTPLASPSPQVMSSWLSILGGAKGKRVSSATFHTSGGATPSYFPCRKNSWAENVLLRLSCAAVGGGLHT